ncbi:MAG: hypothetical protein KTR25_17820 [Myxococcales bacterium]|nr:hypothetical protein [Myxococcales bacterium]
MKRAHTTDERRSRSRRSTEKGPAKRLTHFSDGLLEGMLSISWAREQSIAMAEIAATCNHAGTRASGKDSLWPLRASKESEEYSRNHLS